MILEWLYISARGYYVDWDISDNWAFNFNEGKLMILNGNKEVDITRIGQYKFTSRDPEIKKYLKAEGKWVEKAYQKYMNSWRN